MSASTDTTTGIPSPEAETAVDFLKLDELARLAALASSYWRSVELAAERGDVHLLTLHCRQIGAVTREAFALVKALGSEEAAP